MRAREREARARKAATARWAKHNAEKKARERVVRGLPPLPPRSGHSVANSNYAGETSSLTGDERGTARPLDTPTNRLSTMSLLLVHGGPQAQEFSKLLAPVREHARHALLHGTDPDAELAECWELVGRAEPAASRFLRDGTLEQWVERRIQAALRARARWQPPQ